VAPSRHTCDFVDDYSVPLITRRPKPQLAQMNRIDKHIQWSLVLQSYFALLKEKNSSNAAWL
jgi:hypothetical protein